MSSIRWSSIALAFTLATTTVSSHASEDEFIGVMAGNILGFAMVSERFPSTACGKYVKHPSTMRVYHEAEKTVSALLSPRLRGELKSALSTEPDLVMRGAEKLLVPIDRLSGSSDRENCLLMAAMIISMYSASLHTLKNYAEIVGIR